MTVRQCLGLGLKNVSLDPLSLHLSISVLTPFRHNVLCVLISRGSHGEVGLASSTQHHQGDGPPRCLDLCTWAKDREQCAVVAVVVEVVATTVLSKLGLSPSRVGEADIGRNWWCLDRLEYRPWCTGPANTVPRKQHLAARQRH